MEPKTMEFFPRTTLSAIEKWIADNDVKPLLILFKESGYIVVLYYDLP